MIVVECECGKRCGQKFEVPEPIYEEARAFEDGLISNNCPHRQSLDPYVLVKCESFSVFTTIDVRQLSVSV